VVLYFKYNAKSGTAVQWTGVPAAKWRIGSTATGADRCMTLLLPGLDKNCLNVHLSACVCVFVCLSACRFPLFTAIHKICIGELAPEQLVDCLKDHPAHQ